MGSFVDFFREKANTTVLYLPPKLDAAEVEKQLESLRIYVDGTNIRPDGTVGRALNYNMKTEAAVIEETIIKHEETKDEDNGMSADVDDDNLDELRKKEMTKAEKTRL